MTIESEAMVLDNEAIGALLDTTHISHRRIVAKIEVANARRDYVTVPVAVRVEAGWDRNDRRSANANRLVPRDDVLGADEANRAVQLRRAASVSVADAAVAVAAERAPKPAVIITSDVQDMTTLAGLLRGEVRVVRL